MRQTKLGSITIVGVALLFTAHLSSSAKPSDQRPSNQNANLRARLEQVNRDIRTRGLHRLGDRVLLTGYAYGEYYDWDLYFENIYLSYYGVSKYDFTNFEAFLDRQAADGFISRTLGLVNSRPHQMFKPFLAQLAVLGSKQQSDNFEWLRARDYGKLQRYLDRWFAYDTDGNGLPVWNSSDASGMDNQYSRSGNLDSYQDEGVDLACYLVRELQSMALIARHLGNNADETRYLEHARRLSAQINSVFWDGKDGFYYDRNQKTGQRIAVKSVAGFMPLWAGIATPQQAERLVKDHLMNPQEFWTRYPVASYARTEPDYYQGSLHPGECNWRGSTWIPTNYIIFHGLLNYGYKTEARELALRTQSLALDANHVTREFYNAENGSGYGMNPFWGWSALAYVMPLEDKLNYDPTNINGPIKPIVLDTLHIDFK